MRGSPLIRALIAFFVLLCLGWPLSRLTRSEGTAPLPIPVAAAGALKAIGLQLTSTTVPRSIRILHLGREIWKTDAPAQEIEVPLQLAYPQGGIDLQLEVSWPGDGLCAMRVRLTDPEGVDHEKSLWGRGDAVEVLTFP